MCLFGRIIAETSSKALLPRLVAEMLLTVEVMEVGLERSSLLVREPMVSLFLMERPMVLPLVRVAVPEATMEVRGREP